MVESISSPYFGGVGTVYNKPILGGSPLLLLFLLSSNTMRSLAFLVVFCVSYSIQINWVGCPVFTPSKREGKLLERRSERAIDSASNRKILSHYFVIGNTVSALCTTVNVTLNRDVENSPDINYFVKKIFYGNSSSSCTKQLWLLQGGPGAPGSGLELDATYYADKLRDACIYVPGFFFILKEKKNLMFFF